MLNFKYILFFLVLVFSSCIRENIDPCEQIVNINVKITDTAYFNEARSGNITFSSYIDKLYYELYESELLVDKDSRPTKATTGTLKNYSLTFKNLEVSNYSIVLWGGSSSGNKIQELHPENKEYNDIYTGSDEFKVYYPITEKTIGMQRTKGLLRIFSENIPLTYTHIELKIGNIYKTVDNNLRYKDTTHISKLVPITNSFETFVSPSAINQKAIIELRLFQNSAMVHRFSDIGVVINRNEITQFKIKYNLSNWEVSVKIDGNWESIDNLTIE